MRRPVIVARINGTVASLRPARDACIDDVVTLVERAAVVDYRRTRAGVVLAARRLPDVEAAAELSRWFVVVRSDSSAAA
ncbi:MAG: hypothetical protein LCI03_20600 [Actinobacteria bacterium]|nr:hypothetical protein [Actinomycetota bacterium]